MILRFKTQEFLSIKPHRGHISVTVTLILATETLRDYGEYHNYVIKLKHFPRYWPFVRGIHRSPVISPHKGQWRRALMFSLICAWTNGSVNNRAAGDLGRHRAHYDVTIMVIPARCLRSFLKNSSGNEEITNEILEKIIRDFKVIVAADCPVPLYIYTSVYVSIPRLIFLGVKPEWSEMIVSIACLLMTWLLASPAHQQRWYRPYKMNKTFVFDKAGFQVPVPLKINLYIPWKYIQHVKGLRSPHVSRLLYSPSLVAIGLPAGYETRPPIGGPTLFWLVDLKIT